MRQSDQGGGRLIDPRANPLAGNPFASKGDLQRAVRDLVAPLLAHMSPSGARVRLGSFAAVFPQADAELEGFARPLFGLVPLAAGGGEFAHWERWQQGLAAGVDPEHPDHWSLYENTAQTMVEQAAIGLGLALVPEILWAGQTGRTQEQLVAWLQRIERFEPVPNNWHFFRILVQLGLERVGAPVDRDAQERSLALLDGLHLGDGWYQDGEGGARDHYVPWAFHAYGLIFARLAPDHPLAGAFRERARLIAPQFEAWSDPRGGVIPFGRSLTYRFATGAFWSALAFADEPALPWGVVKGLLLRNLRHWSTRPISDRDGVLSIGWGYANPWMRELYNSAGSPYWAMKAFLCLALPDGHPFWRAEESPIAPCRSAQSSPGMLVSRDAVQSVALSGLHGTDKPFDQSAAKYARLAYSSAFGPTLELEAWGHAFPGDSCLVFGDPGARRRIVRLVEHCEVHESFVYSRWSAGPGILVHTLLTGGAPWHLRVHRVVCERPLEVEETGFAVGGSDALGSGPSGSGFHSHRGVARVEAREGTSEIRDLGDARREARVQPLPPNASLTVPFSAVPALRARLDAGTHELCCAVYASTVAASSEPPALPDAARRLLDAHCPLG